MDLLTKPILIGAAAAALVGWAGAGVQTWRLHSETAAHARDVAAWADEERERAEALGEVLKRQADEFAEQAALSLRLGQWLADKEAERLKAKQETKDAIARTATGRTCLDDSLLGVLNGTANGRPQLPPATPAPGRLADDGAGTGGAAPHPDDEATEEVATDADVAGWIEDARELFASCSGRVKAWQEWYRALPPDQAPAAPALPRD